MASRREWPHLKWATAGPAPVGATATNLRSASAIDRRDAATFEILDRGRPRYRFEATGEPALSSWSCLDFDDTWTLPVVSRRK
jgi:hypothetical protein